MRKKKKTSSQILLFLIYEIIIIAVTVPIITFYGPFQNVKKTVVGTAMATMSHQFIAKTFLSKAEIDSILNRGVGSSGQSEALSNVKISNLNNKSIEEYDVSTSKFKGYILEIKDPTRINIGFTNSIGQVGQRTSEIAAENGAVAAINGGGFADNTSSGKLWTGTGAYPQGIVISNGKVIYSDVKPDYKVNVTAFTRAGKLVVGNYSVNQLEKMNVKEAISFRETLLLNGKALSVQDEGLNPRTAIGQKADGTIIMLVIDGRQGLMPGATLKEVQNILLQEGVVNASNLDGGSSSTMYLNGEVINSPCDWNGERTVATALYVK